MSINIGIEVKNLTKTYKVKNHFKKYSLMTAVDNISFTIPSGDIVGFIGANGAGKFHDDKNDDRNFNARPWNDFHKWSEFREKPQADYVENRGGIWPEERVVLGYSSN